jgi:hypothetical protein
MGYLANTNSGKKLNVNTSFAFAHTTHASANFLVVCVGAVDATITDCECTGVSTDNTDYAGGTFTEAVGLEHALSGTPAHSSIWYIQTNGSETHNITVSFNRFR